MGKLTRGRPEAKVLSHRRHPHGLRPNPDVDQVIELGPVGEDRSGDRKSVRSALISSGWPEQRIEWQPTLQVAGRPQGSSSFELRYDFQALRWNVERQYPPPAMAGNFKITSADLSALDKLVKEMGQSIAAAMADMAKQQRAALEALKGAPTSFPEMARLIQVMEDAGGGGK